MKKFGLLGQKLGHSYSPRIHAMLYDDPYELYEVPEGNLARFLETTDLAGMNVTIPYKKAVIPFCTELSDAARRIGSVNTLVQRDGGWYGDNTDHDGFLYMVRSSGAVLRGKKSVILGNGGASLAVRAALEDLGAGEIVVISRRGEDNYTNLERHARAAAVVNATPVGMYPNNGAAAADLAAFPDCEAVFDLIYNPSRTALLLQAEARGLTYENGLGMLVAQARRSAELFTGRRFDDARVEEIAAALRRETENIILIGMPGSGKSSVGRTLAKRLGRPFFDADQEIIRAAGLPIPEIFRREGEAGFRKRETEVLSKLGKMTSAVIATGGGCVTRRENYPLLHQNGVIVWLRRALEKLPETGRPLSQRHGAQELYAQRKELYAAFADCTVDNDMDIAGAAEKLEFQWSRFEKIL